MNSQVLRRTYTCFLALAAFGLVAGCKKQNNSGVSHNATPPPSVQSAQTGDGYFKTSFQTESQFVLETIVTDIAEMLYFAGHHELPAKEGIAVTSNEVGGTPEAPVYDLNVRLGDLPAVQAKLSIAGPIWSEAVYAEITRVLAQSLRVASPSAASGKEVSVLEHLTDGLAETIAHEDMEVSAALEKDFSNPALHEQAAAVLGAFAQRENSGPFYDIRLPLCRMTAHLAVARFLSAKNSLGLVGQVARCMLLTEMNNEVAALEEVDRLDTTQKAVATWARVLRAENTLDFRPLDASVNVPGVEQVTWFAAYSAANNRGVAWKKVGSAVESRTDFCRIAASMGFGVEIGNQMMQIWLPLELGESRAVYQALQGKELSEEELVPALNAEPDRCFTAAGKGAPQVRVIGWGLWALQLQHHLCMALSKECHILRNWQGLPEEAKDFSKKSARQFGRLRFYDFVRRMDCTDAATYRKSVDDGWAFMQKYPHLTPVAWMSYLCGKVSFAPLYLGNVPNPHCNEWTVHNPLPGTAYDAGERLNFPSFTGAGESDIAKVRKVHALAPFDLSLCAFIGRSYGTNWTYEAATATYGPLIPYSAFAAACVANSKSGEPPEYERLMEMAVKWDPSYYQNLADYQWDHGRTNEAMKTYDREEQEDPDAVVLSHLAERRVRYYLATGQKDRAKQIADFAADVYSARGLAAKAVFLEETGDLAGAFDWYGKIEERYNSSSDVLAFCARHTTYSGDPALARLIVARMRDWYQNAEKVSLSQFKKPPTDGVLISEPGPLLGKISVKAGDVMVAMRGVRIHNNTELTFARDLDTASEVGAIFWQGNGYEEKTIVLDSRHHLGAMTDNYRRQ